MSPPGYEPALPSVRKLKLDSFQALICKIILQLTSKLVISNCENIVVWNKKSALIVRDEKKTKRTWPFGPYNFCQTSFLISPVGFFPVFALVCPKPESLKSLEQRINWSARLTTVFTQCKWLSFGQLKIHRPWLFTPGLGTPVCYAIKNNHKNNWQLL